MLTGGNPLAIPEVVFDLVGGLLQVALDSVRVARLRVVGILPELLLGPALAKQIPAAVELNLDGTLPLPIGLELLDVGGVGLLALSKLFLLGGQPLDALSDALVARHSRIVLHRNGNIFDFKGLRQAAPDGCEQSGVRSPRERFLCVCR